jgi:hypothetical protein
MPNKIPTSGGIFRQAFFVPRPAGPLKLPQKTLIILDLNPFRAFGPDTGKLIHLK